MANFYAIDYWYRDEQYGKEQTGTFFCTSLIDVNGFFNMVNRLMGKCRCDISQLTDEDIERKGK